MTSHELADLLDARGFDFFTGVPCSRAEGLIAALERDPRGRRAPYIPAVREDIALGLAAACGYARAETVDSAAGVESALRGALEADGPSFILARVSAVERPVPRIPYGPEEIRDRFRRAVGSP